MDKHALWKWLILVGLVSFSIWTVWPPMDTRNEEGAVVRSGKIRLGLDLRGGTSFAVKIDEDLVRNELRTRFPDYTDEQLDDEVQEVMQGAQDRTLEVMRNRVDKLGIAEPIIYPGKDNRIIIQLPGIDEAKRKEAEESIKSVAFLEFRMVHERNGELTAALFEDKLVPEGYRIDFIEGRPYFRRDPNAVPDSAMNREFRERLGRFEVPDAAYEFMLSKDKAGEVTVYRPYFVKRRRELSGEYLKSAAVDYQAMGQPVVRLQFDSKGAKKFASITSDYAPGGPRNPDTDSARFLAIVLDGTLYSAPYIREAIYGGRAEISGSFSLPEASFLRNILNSGSLPAPVRIVEKRFVAPSLGKDSIDSGVRAIIYGGIGVLAFMLLYYLLAGLIADMTLILNMILLPLGMIAAAGFLGIFAKEAGGGGPIKLPVLTLPGIAGILLTIGMAVDANVLIFERIREESRIGKRLWTAITAGYDRAFLTILDANLTTLLTGVILFIFGSGPIRGFAVTLCAGIAVSMYTALVVTRMVFGVLASKTSLKTVKMLSVIRSTSIDFVSKRVIAAVFSVVLIVGSWGLMAAKGAKDSSAVFGVDFTGGTSVTMEFEQDQADALNQSVDQIRAALKKAGIAEAHVQFQREMQKDGDQFLQIKTGGDLVDGKKPSAVMVEALAAAFPDAGFSVAQEDDVGPQIGRELKKRAVWSIVFALLGIIIYISWRFELGFAVGAIVALTHDVLITVGIYTLCGRQLSLPVVAALLTIVGYSVNDTIVVFDRIREDLRLVRNKSFTEICNLSINQTLSRTVLTSFTTMITIVMLLVFGGGAINDFALALFIGVLVGTYSSIFVATPVVLLWHKNKLPEFAAPKSR